jgi:hypothetical protein
MPFHLLKTYIRNPRNKIIFYILPPLLLQKDALRMRAHICTHLGEEYQVAIDAKLF